MKIIDRILFDWVWQLPQNLLGVLWKNIKKDSIITDISNDDIKSVGAKTFLVKDGGAVSLGKYVFVSQTYRDRDRIIKHECGHVKQSKMLGPLYLIVIGVPSILHAWLNDYIGCDKKSGYSHFYTEKWADKLMSINT